MLEMDLLTNLDEGQKVWQLADLPLPPANRHGWPWTEEARPLPAVLPDRSPWPRITIVIPSYQQGIYLEETLRSVLLQGYPNLECRVIDGGSTDCSLDVIKTYAPYMSYWVSEPDYGQAHAINKGFASSTGEIMGWLNSDDILLPDALRRIAETFVMKRSVMVVTGFRKVYDRDSRFYFNFIRDLPTNYYIRHYCSVAQETTYWRRSVWQELGPLDENFHFAMDYEYWLRMVEHGYSLHLMPYYTGGFRWYAEGKTSSRRDVYFHDIGIIYERYQMGSSEEDVLRPLGRKWRVRLRLLADVGFKSISDSPRRVILIFRLLENPRLCNVVLAFYRRYRNYRRGVGGAYSAKEAAVKTVLAVPPHLLKSYWRLYRIRAKQES